jgi:hypothetical protein
LKISGQNDYLVGVTISGDVTFQFVILIIPMFSFLESGPGRVGKCAEIVGLSSTAT